jgi:CubicO group peptidase (beta-lactamase class C family)
MKNFYILFLFAVLFINCSSDEDKPEDVAAETMYFPPMEGTSWETIPVSDLNWNLNELPELLDYLEEKNTKGFIILVNGRIALENYFNGHTETSAWYWASAGKTLTTATLGIAQEEKLLNINHKVSDYLGTGWTSAPLSKENLITNRHLLCMTSGLDDALGDGNTPADLQYKADAGTRWAYHNVFEKLQDVIAKSGNQTFVSYFNMKLRDRIGMTGAWIESGEFNVYWSTTRSMARFGLLSLNEGKWDKDQIIPAAYLNEATHTSQTLNNAYGYLWWLNGKSSYRLPQTQLQFQGSLIPDAPNDMFCALGKNDQKIYVIPGKKMVIIRMGEAATGENFALSGFDNELWKKINAVIQE